MDVVTHTLVGVALANAGSRQKYGRGTTAVLVAASNLCDIDVVSVAAGTCGRGPGPGGRERVLNEAAGAAAGRAYG